MSSILKGLNESNSVYGHSDPDREYGAPATSYGKRGPYYQTDDDDDGNPFAEYERQQRMFAQGRAQKAAKEKAQRDADHDRLATGTNEARTMSVPTDVVDAVKKFKNYVNTNFDDLASMTSFYGDNYNKPYVEKKFMNFFKMADGTPITPIFNEGGYLKIYGNKALNIPIGRYWKFRGFFNGSQFVEDILKLLGYDPSTELTRRSTELKKTKAVQPMHSELNELSNEKLGQYKTAAAADAGKADIAGDYKKADKRFSGIVKATKKQFANDTKTVKEADGQKEFILYINNKPAAKYVDQLQAERDMASVKKKHPQVRIELKHEVCDLETVKKINENQLMGNALEEAKSLLKQLDETTQQQVINALTEGVGLDIDRSIPGRTIARVSDRENKLSSKAKSLPSFMDRDDDYQQWSGKTSASTHDDEEDTFDIDYTGDEDGELDENLHKWFKEKWVRFGPDGKIRGDCARGDDSEGKPKCLPQSKAHSLGKKGRASAAARKRREDPNPERSGKAINVNTKKKTNEAELDEACWKGYHKEGNKKMFGKTYPNCVKNTNEEQELNEFAPDGFNGNDGEEFNPNLAKMAYDEGVVKGAGLADGATLERAMAINDWDKHDGGIYSQHFAKGFIAGRKDKIRHNNKQYNLNLKLMKDGSIRHGEQELDEYGDTAKGQKMLAKVHHRAADRVTSKKADTDPKYAKKNQDTANAAYDRMTEEHHSESCPHCGGEMVSEELMNEKKDACYYKVKSRYKVWPSAYASGALVKCRKKGASNWGNGGKSNESIEEDQLDEKWTKKYKDSINCSNPKGFSQKAHCAGKQKNESIAVKESAILKGLK